MTYRDRRAARAERLREWAGKREAKAEALVKQNEPYRGDTAFNTQPGHIPERARAIARDERAWEHSKKATSMASRADEIERQAEHAIYSDDSDAIERLRARIVDLEAERERMKTANAKYRADHKAELRAMTAYERGRAVPWPAYALSNLSGNITRQRQRLAALERRA